MTAFKIDENLPRECRTCSNAPDTTCSRSAIKGSAGIPTDADIAAVLRAERRAIITFDLDFANLTKHRPSDYEGIVVLRLGRQDKPHVLQVMNGLVPRFAASRLAGQLWIVEDAAIRIRT